MIPCLVLELKELRTLPHPDTYPFALQNPNLNHQGRIQELAEERESWGWGEDGVTVAQSCPGLVLGRRTYGRVQEPARAQFRRLLSPRLARGPAASARPLAPRKCPQRLGVEAAERPLQSGVGGGPGGAGGPRSAPRRRPLYRTSYPAPTHPAQPLGETRRKRVALLSRSAEVERSWWLPSAGRTLRAEQPGQRRRRRGAFGAASLLPSPQRGWRGAGRGRVREKNLKLCEGIRSR